MFPQISSINSKHRQKAVISPYSRTPPAYNAQTHSAGFWQHPPPTIGDYWLTQVTQNIVSQPPPPLPTMPSILDIDEAMPPPPPSTTPPPLQPDEKLAGRTNQQRKYHGKNCNSISFKIASKSSPAINYVNNITRSQSQPSSHLQYSLNTSMTSSNSSNSGNGTNSMSENSNLLKTVGGLDGSGGGGGGFTDFLSSHLNGGYMNGYSAAVDSGGGSSSSVKFHEKGEFNKCFFSHN